MREEQQDLFGVFSPTAGVHKAPPNASHPSAPPVPAPRPAVPGASESRTISNGINAAVSTPAHPNEAEELDIVFERSLRAQNYRLTLRRDGVAVATIPLRGSEREARRFVETHREWLERARERQKRRPRAAAIWMPGAHVLWRGIMTEIRIAATGEKPAVGLASDVFRVAHFTGDLRPTLEAHFLRRAKIELPARTWELSAVTGVEVKNVTVRNQRSRWGSCSSGGVISLNWRLVQTPDFVRDYIIYHELMHLREMNHSERFWARVEEVCPGWREAEAWIKRNGSLVGL
jgi:predicted metal-dependent hydrolase